jgi:hypothetical protein
MTPPLDPPGVTAEDPRNSGPIAYFRPEKPTRLSVHATLAPYHRGKDPAELERKVDALMEKIADGHVRPSPPLSQPVEATADVWFGSGTHPDIVDELWKLDDGLPKRCRWLFWGRPALVHPQSGVVFAVGFGSIGLVMRLAPPALANADPTVASEALATSGGRRFDISPAGPEWRFLRAKAPKREWTRGAYDLAGQPS